MPLIAAGALCACADPSSISLEAVHRRAPVTAAPPGPPDVTGHPEDVSGAADVMAIDAPTPADEVAIVADVSDAAAPIDATPDTTDRPSDALPDADTQAPADVFAAPCPSDMLPQGDVCVDRWEAPNVEGALPLVMYTFYEAAAWCEARDKRLCFDDEWRQACGGDADLAYPYGDVRVPGRCNDDKVWRVYDQALLNGWPAQASAAGVTTLGELMASVRARGASAAAAADHVMSLYQGTAAGERPGCVGAAGVEDLVGNVEEWVRRRDGGDGPQFSGALVGRYWAESRTCHSRVTSHGNAFRFYEIGFRCCRDQGLR